MLDVPGGAAKKQSRETLSTALSCRVAEDGSTKLFLRILGEIIHSLSFVTKIK